MSTYVFSVPEYVSLLEKTTQNLENLNAISRAPESKKRYIKPASKCGAPRFKLWQRENWDRFIRDENHFQKSIDHVL